VHLVETLEFFYTLRQCGWDGVWQLDQFPFREDAVEAAREGIDTMRSIHRALDRLDVAALREAQDRQDALAAKKIARQALLSSQA
jgi:xylose isomerase